MATTKILLYKSKKSADNKFLIAIRVTHKRVPKYLFIEWIDEKFWDDKNREVKKASPDYNRLNNLILNKHTQIKNLIFELDKKNKNYSSTQIIETIKNNRQGISFFDFAEDFIKNLEKQGKHKRANPLRGRINQFKKFGNKGSDKLAFEEIDTAFLKKFKTNYIATKEVKERTVINVYIAIRTLYNLAILENIVEAKYYPFGKNKIQIKFPETIKIGLTEKELKDIEKLDLKEGSKTWHARNVFLFSFNLAGVRISDTLEMKWDSIVDCRLHYKMSKNSKADSLKLNEKSMTILSYYEKDKKNNNDFIFPELKKADLKNPKDVYNKSKQGAKTINEGLEEIRKMAKISKKITNHISRHTFGNIAGDQISPKMLQKLYRHSNITTTMGYQGNFIHKNADDALDSVVNF